MADCKHQKPYRKQTISKETVDEMLVRLQQLSTSTGNAELLTAAEMLSALEWERELAVYCIDEVFKAVAHLPQRPADAYFSILRFRKETGRYV